MVDAPGAELNCDRRASTTTAPQSLMLLNSDFVRQQAKHLAARVKSDAGAGATPEKLAETAWRLAYLRAPDDTERRLGASFLATQRGDAGLTNLCQQLLASNEFLYVD